MTHISEWFNVLEMRSCHKPGAHGASIPLRGMEVPRNLIRYRGDGRIPERENRGNCQPKIILSRASRSPGPKRTSGRKSRQLVDQ